MKLYQILLCIFIIGCNVEKTSEDNVSKSRELSNDSKIFFGNRLFSEKTCITCHAPFKDKVGPSIIDIMTIYKEKNGSIEEFLRGNAKPIVDNDPIQIKIMQNNIDGFLQKVTDVELDAIATYMMHVDELHQNK